MSGNKVRGGKDDEWGIGIRDWGFGNGEWLRVNWLIVWGLGNGIGEWGSV
ncbi:hypothetical protein KZP23_14880 [Echinicola marina]|nr:hypothetical protein [Echinicola marina]UCS92002.1 hypothetical protein KZP23_14880 [Echinicola marina]